jgi:hypothetical protein
MRFSHQDSSFANGYERRPCRSGAYEERVLSAAWRELRRGASMEVADDLLQA